MNLLDGLKIGDKVWAIGRGEVTVYNISAGSGFPIHVRDGQGFTANFSASGYAPLDSAEPTLYRARPTITPGKVKVKREVKAWAVLEENGCIVTTCVLESTAPLYAKDHPTWRIVPLTGSYEVEVEG